MKLDFTGVKILVIGDPMVDIYNFGHVDRVSPEAPVPVFIEDRQEVRAGGAANVLNQLRALGCTAVPAWYDGPTFGAGSWKTRYMVGNHQLLRVDHEICVPNTLPSLYDFSAIVISDYAKGACTTEICQKAIRSGLPVIVDPKGTDWTKYNGCTVICPNHLEVNGHDWTNMVIKQGSQGLWYMGVDYPSTAKRVYDVTGAGDCVTAVIAACVATGIDMSEACKLANLAAGYTVEHVGTTVCPIEKLRELCESV